MNETDIAVLKNAIHALTHYAIPDKILGMRNPEKIRVPFQTGNGFGIFIYDVFRMKIESIEYMIDERGIREQ